MWPSLTGPGSGAWLTVADPQREMRTSCNEPATPFVHGVTMIENPRRTHELDHHPRIGGPLDFDELFESERDRLFRALCMLTGDRQEAEDLMQDAFVRVYERWDQVGSTSDPCGYLYRTAMNGFRSQYRRSVMALRRQMPTRERRDEIAEAEQQADIIRHLARLTIKQRAALVLMDILEFSSEEAGKAMAMSPGAVRTQASRARAELRRTEGEDDD